MTTRKLRTFSASVIALLAAAVVAACTADAGGLDPVPEDSAGASEPPPGEFAAQAEVTETVGPNDATGVDLDSITLTPEQIAEVKAGGFSAALLLQTSNDWSDAVTRGADETFQELGIDLVATSNSSYSAVDQANAVKTVLAREPSAIAAWPINPQELAPSLQEAVDSGVKLAFISNMPDGFEHGADYVSVVGDDLYGMGKTVADQLASSIGDEGEIGFMYFNANAYVVNQRDAAFRTVIEQDHPDIDIVASQGFSDPADAFQVASAMLLQNPNLKAIYAPWSEVAAGVLQAIEASQNPDVAVATMDLSNTVALSMASDGPVRALVIDDPYGIGRGLAMSIAASLIGVETPAYVQVPAVPVTRDSLSSAYTEQYQTQVPDQVSAALGQ